MSPISKVLLVGLAGMVFGGSMYMYMQHSQKNSKAAASLAHMQPTAPAIHHVSLTEQGADPANLLIQVGEYVQFDSKDGKTHDIASGAGDGDGEHHDHTATGLESGDFKADEGYRVQFKKIGSYYFHDHLKPSSTISVGVYEPGATSAPL